MCKNFLVSLTASLVLVSPFYVNAQDEEVFDPLGLVMDSDVPKYVTVTCDYYEMSTSVYETLMDDESLRKDDLKMLAKLKELRKKEDVSLFDSMHLVARSGEKASAESILEVIYPTEYEPFWALSEGNEDDEGVATLASYAPPTATAFETRNVGNTLEIEPTIGPDNRTIDLRMAPEIVFHVGEKYYAKIKNDELETDVQMPLFYTLKVTTALTMIDGKAQVVATLSPKRADGTTDHSRKLMVLVRSDIKFVK